jgi:hypothetical protein
MKSAANDREPAGGVCAGFSRGSPVLNPGYQHLNPAIQIRPGALRDCLLCFLPTPGRSR